MNSLDGVTSDMRVSCFTPDRARRRAVRYRAGSDVKALYNTYSVRARLRLNSCVVNQHFVYNTVDIKYNVGAGRLLCVTFK